MGDVDQLLYARAVVRGLTRDHRGWSRGRGHARLVGLADDGRWWWAPESWSWGETVRHAPRFDSEADALSDACDWLDDGEPAVEVPDAR